MDLEAIPFGPPCTGCGEPVRLDALTGSTCCLHACDGPHFRAIDWVIVGGESGPGARPMHPDWARALRDQCKAAGVPFLFKQWGEWLPGQNVDHPAYAPGRKVAHHQDGSWGATATKVNASNYVAWDEDGGMHRGNLKSAPPFRLHAWAEHVGKKAAGRLLDGSTWDGFPAL